MLKGKKGGLPKIKILPFRVNSKIFYIFAPTTADTP